MLTWRNARRAVVFVVGMTVVLFGIALIVLPGPATVVIPVGLTILASEFVWARRLLARMKQGAKALPAIFRKSDNNPVSARQERGGADAKPRAEAV